MPPSPNRARRAAPLLALLCLLALPAGCFRDTGRGHGGRGLLVIVVDGLRADHTSLPGPDGERLYDRRTTPGLEALGREGVWFTDCYSAAPERIPAHAAILTGCDPRIVRRPPVPRGMFLALSREWLLPRAVPALARELLVSGFATAAYVDDPHLDERLGFGSGFEQYQRFPQDVGEGPGFGVELISGRFLSWLRELESDRDWFAYLTVKDLERAWTTADPARDTFFEPREELDHVPPISSARHAYFAVPVDRWDGGLHSVGEYEARYDGAIRQVDLVLQRLLRQIHERGLWETTTICVVGSYGVGFGESGLYLTSGTLSDVDLHVPLIVKPPASWPGRRGVAIDHLASTIDVMPTLLELLGVPPPPGMHGVSHAGATLPDAEPARDAVFASGGVQTGFAVRTKEYAYELARPGWNAPREYATTWSGTRGGSGPPLREHLTRRGRGAFPGNLGPTLGLPEVADELRARGEEHFLWLDRARDAVHQVPWQTEPLDPDVLRELVERGLVAPDAVRIPPRAAEGSP